MSDKVCKNILHFKTNIIQEKKSRIRYNVLFVIMTNLHFMYLLRKRSTTKMCCDLQTHTKVIAIINVLLTGLEIKRTISEISLAVESNDAKEKIIALVYALVDTLWGLAAVLCLVGAFKKNRVFFIPFIIVQSINILSFFILSLLIIFLGLSLIHI